MTDPAKAARVYSEARREDAAEMRAILSEHPGADRFLEHVFWTNALLKEDGSLTTFYDPVPEKGKFNVISFDPVSAPPQVEKTEGFQRLRVTLHRVLDLGAFRDEDGFFSALSHKNRKKLRWLRNAVPALGCEMIPLETEAHFRMFEKLYSAQFGKYPPGCPANEAVWLMYRELIRRKRSFSFLLLSPEKEPISAALGYFSGTGCCYTHLTRLKGAYDKYSPGYYLTFRILMKILAEHPETEYFFMGPGDYDYKRAFLGEPFAIYRYERDSFLNFPALLRLRFRCRKERKKYFAEKK